MAYDLDEVVPWGRSFTEYQAMFDLNDTDLQVPILGCGDGPAGFNAEATKAGHRVVSIDPLYASDVKSIERRIDQVFDTVMNQTRANSDEFVWGTPIRNPDHLAATRTTAMQHFREDFTQGSANGRYIAGALPDLDLADGSFGLALYSHYLFLYSKQISPEEHIASLREPCRVAEEVRVFPLLELGSRPSRHLTSVLRKLTAAGHTVEVRLVSYEFQKRGNQMLAIR